MPEDEIPFAKPMPYAGGHFQIVFHENWRFYTWQTCDESSQIYSGRMFITKSGAYQNAIGILGQKADEGNLSDA